MTLRHLPDLIQGSDEWHDQRRGLVTASAVGKLISVGPPAALSVGCSACGSPPDDPCVSTARKTPTAIKSIHEARSAYAASRPPVVTVADNETSRGLTATLIAERITGWTEETPMTPDMWRGVEAEPWARDVYSQHHAQAIETGFMVREEEDWKLGYSPDGLVGEDGLIEIKAPRAKTHLRTILADEVPAHYMAQCQSGLLVSGRKWIDFVSYVGGMPLFVKRVHPDPAWHAAITAACQQFQKNAAEMVANYHTSIDGLATTERVHFEIAI